MNTFRPWRLCIILVIVTASGVGSALAKDVVLVLNDGRRISGELVSQSPEGVVVKIAGISTTFPKELIAKVEEKLTVTEQYEQKLARLAKDDLAGRYQLAQWLYEQGDDKNVDIDADERKKADALAVRQLDWLLRDEPNNVQAKMLRGLTVQRIQTRQLAEAAKAAQPAPTAPAADPQEDDTPASAVEKAQYLTAEQRNLLKIYEIDLKSKPKVVIRPDTIKKIYDNPTYRASSAMSSYQGRTGEAKFRNLQGYEQLSILFDMRARDLYSEAVVRDEPEPLTTFRQRINPTYVARYCGDCHAYGKAKKGPVFFTRKGNSEEVAYTNFLILSRTAGAKRDLLDRQNPEESLLLQYGLPTSEAAYPHPEVKNRRQYFSGPKDRRYLEMVDWVKTLYRPAPEYPIGYTLPKPLEPEAPAPQPAAEPAKAAGANGN